MVVSAVLSCTWIKAKYCLVCPRNKLCFTINCPVISLGAPSTSPNLLLALPHLAVQHPLSTLPIFDKHSNKTVFFPCNQSYSATFWSLLVQVHTTPSTPNHWHESHSSHLLPYPSSPHRLKATLSAWNNCLSIKLFVKVQVSSSVGSASHYSRAPLPSATAGSNLPYRYSISLQKLMPQKMKIAIH